MRIRNIVLACVLGAALPAVAGPRYTVTPLPVGTNPTGINSAGQISGDFGTVAGRRGFIWSAGSLVQIGTFGGENSMATGINSSGHAVGYASLPSGDSHAFVFANGVLTDLGVFGGANSFGSAINNRGQVAGQFLDATPNYRAFVHSGGVATDLGTLGGSFAYGAGINNLGHVVGGSALDDASPFLSHAFVYRDGVMTDLGTLGGSYSLATSISDNGLIAGHAWVDGSEHAFLYVDGVMRDLGTLGGRRSFAYGINGAGQVVGNSNDVEDFNYYAFLYEGGAMLNLNGLIDPALGWTLHSAIGINDSQQIAAYGCRGEACGAVLLSVAAPVPEPGTLALLLAGLGVLSARRFSAAYRRA
ncbi:MAG: PEP-CTERM sorting domain-containing protein [Pseudomonadota bacterium]